MPDRRAAPPSPHAPATLAQYGIVVSGGSPGFDFVPHTVEIPGRLSLIVQSDHSAYKFVTRQRWQRAPLSRIVVEGRWLDLSFPAFSVG